MKTTIEKLQLKQALPLDEKIEYSLNKIKQFYKHTNGSVYVAFSGGIDSTVLLHMVRSIYPNTIAVFCNTTREYPEIVKFVRSTENTKTMYPKMNYQEVIEKHGFPLVSKKVATSITHLRNPSDKNQNVRRLFITGLNRKDVFVPSYKLAKKWYSLFDKEKVQFNITSKCCDILKKEPMHRFEKETKLKAFVGTMADESRMRQSNYISYGCNILGKKPKSRPLSIWTESDIWSYINKYNIPYCDIYDDKTLPCGTIIKGETTTGCIGCGFGNHLEKEDQNRFDKLKLRKPHSYTKIMNMKNNGVTFKDALSFIKGC